MVDLAVAVSGERQTSVANGHTRASALSSLDNRDDALCARQIPLGSIENEHEQSARESAMSARQIKLIPGDVKQSTAQYPASPHKNTTGKRKALGDQSENFWQASPAPLAKAQQAETIKRKRPTKGGKTVSVAKPVKPSKRMSPEQLRLLSRRIDPSIPLDSPDASPPKPALPVLYCPSPRKRFRRSVMEAEQSDEDEKPKISSLYQTCSMLWPGPPSLGELSSDNVRSLSELLKVRLSQAKFRVIAALEAEGKVEQEKQLYDYLKTEDCSSWPIGKPTRYRIQLSRKRNQGSPSLTVVGNSKNLFSSPARRSSRTNRTTSTRLNLPMCKSPDGSFRNVYNSVTLVADDTDNTFAAYSLGSSLSPQDTPMQRKARPQPLSAEFSPNTASPKSSSKARRQNVSTILLENGMRLFVCQSCNKQYKNRNGLYYHLDRCKGPSSGKKSPKAKSSQIRCICNSAADDGAVIVKCDTCHYWLHLACLGIEERELGDAYHCPRCTSPTKPDTNVAAKEQLNSTAANVDNHSLFMETSNENGFCDKTLVQEDEDDNAMEEIAQANATAAQQSMWDNIFMSPGFVEDWSQVREDESITSTPWSISEMSLPSLLFSDNAMSSIFDNEDISAMTPATSVANTPLASDSPTPQSEARAVECANGPTSQSENLWFEFANFDDDFRCDNQ